MQFLNLATAKRALCALAACLLLPAIWGEFQRGSLIGAALAVLVFGCFTYGTFFADPAATFFAKNHRWPAFMGEAVCAFLAYKLLYVALSDLHRHRMGDFIGDMTFLFFFLAGVFWRHLEVRGMLRRAAGR